MNKNSLCVMLASFIAIAAGDGHPGNVGSTREGPWIPVFTGMTEKKLFALEIGCSVLGVGYSIPRFHGYPAKRGVSMPLG